ncbi:hypothetical protein GQ457_12G017020 [Hibiscus cannabinus]
MVLGQSFCWTGSPMLMGRIWIQRWGSLLTLAAARRRRRSHHSGHSSGEPKPPFKSPASLFSEDRFRFSEGGPKSSPESFEPPLAFDTAIGAAPMTIPANQDRPAEPPPSAVGSTPVRDMLFLIRSFTVRIYRRSLRPPSTVVTEMDDEGFV